MVSSGDVDDAIERRHRRGRGRADRDLPPSSSAAPARAAADLAAIQKAVLTARFFRKSCENDVKILLISE